MATMIEGFCHCGNISFEIRTEAAKSEIMARACECRFCRLHAAKTWSDPKGHAWLKIRDAQRLQRYLFAQKTAEFYICKTCGAYAAAVLSDCDGSWATFNLRLTRMADIPQTRVSYSGESSGERASRRKRKWTPTVVTGVG